MREHDAVSVPGNWRVTFRLEDGIDYGKTRRYQSTKARAEGLSSRKNCALIAVP